MKAVLAFVLCFGLALVCAEDQVSHHHASLASLSALSGGSSHGSHHSHGSHSSHHSAIAATPLQSVSGSLSFSGSSGCIDANPCGGASLASNAVGDEKASVDDAVKPVDEWIKDFKKRTMGDGSDLYGAAKATVRPLLNKLRRSQKKAQLKLQESNDAIIRHVEEVTTQHVYTLLKADSQKTKSEERKEEQAAKILDAKSAEKDAKEKLNAQLGLNSEQAAALDSALKSSGVAPTQSVVNNIAKLLSSESASAMKAVSTALKTALKNSKF